MNIRLQSAGPAGAHIPVTILGQNIEMCLTTANGLLSERLRNPKLVGPPHRMTGIAPEWQGVSCGQATYELTPGAGLMGSEAQFIRGKSGRWLLRQNRLSVRAGERLELEIWARALHQPVDLKISLMPIESMRLPYDQGDIRVDASWYKRYTLTLTPREDREDACLGIQVAEEGAFWIDQIHLRPAGEPLLCQGVITAMADMRIPTLRFPGGIVCNAYNWKHGTGPAHLRPAMLEAAFHQNWDLNYDFGLDEYLRICIKQDIIPTLTLNVATGTPEEAAGMAAYCANVFRQAGVTPPPIYWNIANHPYSETTAHMTPAMYRNVIETFVPAIKKAYPDNRIIAVMPREALNRPAAEFPWKQALLELPADAIDGVAVQTYGACDMDTPPDQQLRTLGASLDGIETDLRAFIAECRSHSRPWTVCIAEWNWWLRASHWDGRAFEEPPTPLHGLFIAGMIHRFAALAPDVEAACFYNLVNCMGILNHRNADVDITDAVDIFTLYRAALPGRLVPMFIEGETGTRPEGVDALCVEKADERWVFLINRQASTGVQVDLSALAPDPSEVVLLHADTPLGRFKRSLPGMKNQRIDLPALSIARIRIVNER